MHLQGNQVKFDKSFARFSLSYESNSEIINDLYFKRTREIYEVDFVCAAHWLITCKCLETVGGFSPTFPHYGEDNNYIHRALYHKFKVGIVPSSFAVHDREFREELSNEKKDIYGILIRYFP